MYGIGLEPVTGPRRRALRRNYYLAKNNFENLPRPCYDHWPHHPSEWPGRDPQDGLPRPGAGGRRVLRPGPLSLRGGVGLPRDYGAKAPWGKSPWPPTHGARGERGGGGPPRGSVGAWGGGGMPRGEPAVAGRRRGRRGGGLPLAAGALMAALAAWAAGPAGAQEANAVGAAVAAGAGGSAGGGGGQEVGLRDAQPVRSRTRCSLLVS